MKGPRGEVAEEIPNGRELELTSRHGSKQNGRQDAKKEKKNCWELRSRLIVGLG